jgi:hypothetical protein
MLDRLRSKAPILLRLACLCLGALLIYQLARLAVPRTRAFTEFTPGGIVLEPETGATNTAASPIPAEVTAQIEKIKESQILGQIMHPPPMAVIGIAGRDVLFRAPNGQTGLLREGEELGGVKLIKVGTNRVLVEENNQQKELTIFQGFGSESLLPKKENSKPSETSKN